MDPFADGERAGGDDGAEIVDTGMVADLDVGQPDNRPGAGNGDILANALEAEGAEFIGAVLPGVERVFHARKLTHPDSGGKP